jgi:hypothetical protein
LALQRFKLNGNTITDKGGYRFLQTIELNSV